MLISATTECSDNVSSINGFTFSDSKLHHQPNNMCSVYRINKNSDKFKLLNQISQFFHTLREVLNQSAI